MTIAELMERYLAQMAVSRKADTMADYRYRLTRLQVFGEGLGWTYPGDMTAEGLTAFAAHLEGSPLTVNTRYMMLAAVKHFLMWLYTENLLFLPLADALTLPKWEKKKKKVYTKKQVETMLQKMENGGVIQTRNKLIVALALVERLRTPDMYVLSLMDVDVATQEIRLMKRKQFHRLRPTTAALLHAYLKQRHQLRPKVDWLLVNQFGERLQGQDIANAVKEALRA